MAEKKSKAKADKQGKEKKEKKRSKDSAKADQPTPIVSLLADAKNVDSKLSSLFAVQAPLTKAAVIEVPLKETSKVEAEGSDDNDDAALQVTAPSTKVGSRTTVAESNTDVSERKPRKRKRNDQADDLEDNYMRKLARQENSEETHEDRRPRVASQPIKELDASDSESEVESEDQPDEDTPAAGLVEDESADDWTPPQHETQSAASNDLDKAGRTVFVGNVSTSAITTKTARKTFEKHLASFFDKLHKPADTKTVPKIESLRFRSTPYDPKLPKKAAYARGEVMSTTAQSTNAYVVYSTPALAREACRRLNGTIVLDRHIRVDSVAHPAPMDHKRCVFVGGLSFVDDETNIIAANEAEGREKRKQNQKPSDVEEGLWRLFAKHGTVESVRVVRDKNTRVGIGIAYVQFTDENAVEAALSEDGKKAPPMLPRKLRVARAKAMKRSKAAPEKARGKQQSEGYQRKITPGEATLRGRLGKLMGKAAAATAPSGFKGPESFVFEGHRASSNSKNSGLKLGKAAKRKGKPTNRSARRAAAYKTGNAKKAS